MPNMILPGVYIDVRAEGLIIPGLISVGNIGIVGTAARGPFDVQTLGGLDDAHATFGFPDSFSSPNVANKPLSLVRALELAYANGAATVQAVRVAKTKNDGTPDAASTIFHLATASGGTVVLTANSPGSWGDKIAISVMDGVPSTLAKVRLTYRTTTEEYVAEKGTDLVARINTRSSLVQAAATGDVSGKPTTPVAQVVITSKGSDGADATSADYGAGLDLLLKADVQIIVAAGQDDTVIGNVLRTHVEVASNDTYKRNRIGVVGSTLGVTKASDLMNFSAPSDRMIFVAPGIKTTDVDGTTPITLPGAYTAAVVAGMISGRDPQASLTNQSALIDTLEVDFNSGELEQLVEANVLVLEDRPRLGVRVVKGITTDTTGAFSQITTRRIVDYAIELVRASADPYIGLLNNDRVRKALKATINGSLAEMVDNEQLESYDLDVSATRPEEIRGIARVTLTLLPTFSIDYIVVTMYLQ